LLDQNNQSIALTQKIVESESDFRIPSHIPDQTVGDNFSSLGLAADNLSHNRDVNIKFKYQYILSSDGDSENNFSYIPHDEGLYVSITGFIEGRELMNVKDFASYGISETYLKEQSEQQLQNLLNYWVDNYPDSKFKHDEFGTYEIVDKIRFSDDDRMKELLDRFESRGKKHDS